MGGLKITKWLVLVFLILLTANKMLVGCQPVDFPTYTIWGGYDDRV